MEEYYNLSTLSSDNQESGGDYTPLNKDEVQEDVYEIPEPPSQSEDPAEDADLIEAPSEDDPDKILGASEEEIFIVEPPPPSFTLPWKLCVIIFVLINIGVVGFLVYHVISIGREANVQSYRVSLLQHKMENLVKNLMGVGNVRRKETWLESDPSWAVLASGTPHVIDSVTFDAGKALDGDVTTHWNPVAHERYSNDYYIVLDLKSIHDLSKIALTNFGDTTHDVTEFTLQASLTSSPYEWRDVIAVSDVKAGTNRSQVFEEFSVTSRFFKFTVTATQQGWQPWLREIRIFGAETAGEGGCQAGYKSLDDGCYRFSLNQLSFEDSRKVCWEDGGHLAIVKNPTTHTSIVNYIKTTTNSSYWIGLQLKLFGARVPVNRRGMFFWEDGTLLTGWEGWHEGEPSSIVSGGREDCVEMANFMDYEWNDKPCNYNLSYICQVDMV